MRRDYFYIGVAIFMVIVVAMFITLSILGQQKRNSAVKELQSRVAEIKKRTDSQHNSNRKSSVLSTDEGEADQNFDDEENIAAHKQLAEKMNTLKESTEWQQVMESLVRIDDGEDTAEDHQRIVALLDANRGLIVEIRRIAGSNNGYSDELLSSFIQYVRLLTMNMMLSATRGDYETLFLDFETAKALVGSARKNPDLMSQLVSNGMCSILYKCIEENVLIEYLPPDRIGELIAFASDATDRARIADAVFVEGVECIEVFDDYRKIDKDINPYRLFYATIGRPFLDMDEGYYADTMNQAYITMRRPFNEAKPILEDLQKIEFSELSIFLHPVSFLSVPAFTRYAQQQAFHEAQMGLMQVGLAVEQYCVQHDEYPQTLDSIAPALDGELPLDPYTGQNFVYESGNTDFTLYSALGSMVSAEEYKYPGTDNSGNIVWRYRE